MGSNAAAVAHFNAPARDADLEASFANLPDAQAYAEAYGGEVEAIGTAFLVRDADHVRARDDAAKLAKGESLDDETPVETEAETAPPEAGSAPSYGGGWGNP